jgi:hypothetical protein
MAAAVKMYTNEHLAVRALALSHQNPSDAKSTVCTTLSRFTEGWSFSGHACHARVGTFICPRVHTASRTWRTLACVCTRCAARSGGYMMMKAKAGGVLAWRFCTVHIHDGRHSMLGEPSVRTRTRTCRRGYLCMARYPLEDLALAAMLVQAAAAASTRIDRITTRRCFSCCCTQPPGLLALWSPTFPQAREFQVLWGDSPSYGAQIMKGNRSSRTKTKT